MVVFVLLIGVVFSIISNNKGKGPIPSSVSKTNGFGIVFNKDLKDKPVVDLWEDFQCPICARFEETNGKFIQQLITEKRATVIFHTLSFIGPESILAANAGACAADEGKFLQLHAYLYANQGTENTGVWSNQALILAGAGAGITSTKFAECISAGTYTSWVDDVAKDGTDKGINSTPTVFVNGKELDRNTQYFDAAAFQAAIEG